MYQMNVINLTWNSQTANWWNESCALIIEHFGLPGHRYVSKPGTECMSFTFKNQKDADLCRILLSERL